MGKQLAGTLSLFQRNDAVVHGAGLRSDPHRTTLSLTRERAF